MKQILIFTDLDGTLIDHDTYDFKEAQPALDQLRSRSIPVIICSSKTRAEIEVYRRRMGLRDPFIVENGGAVFIPSGVLDLSPPPSPPPSRGRVWEGVDFVEKGPYRVVELGVPYADLCTIWKKIKKKNFRMKGFSEMTIDEIAACTGLPLEEASSAARREYSEPFMFSGTSAQFRLLESLLQEKGLRITRGGRFYHMIGQNDKGTAVQILRRIYANTYPDKRIWTAGLGDSANDIPMLEHVDMPIVIRKKTGEWEHIQGIEHIIYSDKAGPRGWAEMIHTILF
jgi:mannosyl-3-phosphoglycerate phosphatase